MKRWIAMIALTSLTVLPALCATDAWARAGGGGSSGSRGSRSYSAPSSPGAALISPARPSPAPPSTFQQSPQRSGWGPGIGGMLGGLVLGGLIGSLLFGGTGQMSGGIGLLEIILIGGLAYFAFSFFRSRQAATAAPAGYADPGAMGASWHPEPTSRSTVVVDAPVPAGATDLARGVVHIRQMDPGFDPRASASRHHVFFRVQAAWMARDMESVRTTLTEEMHATMQAQCQQLRAQRRVNRLENIAVRSVEVTETWQEAGRDFVTVRFLASLLDFTTDESGAQLLDGSRTEPVKFEEYWTVARPVGSGPWRLSAIQQPS